MLASVVATRDGASQSTAIHVRDLAALMRRGCALMSQASQANTECIRLRFLHMSDEPASPKLQVQIDDDIAQGVYSNLVLLNHTENEFVLDFAFIQPSNGRAKVRTRVISSPRHTKRLLAALQKNLERYEERFGTIDVSTDDDPVFH
jgi:hypothetical protein